MLITAVITTHKRSPELVERALKSILNQTYTNIEIFVVDDSPVEYEFRPAVKSMVESYAEKNVTYIAHDRCMGACAARNTGLDAAKGDFIGFLDDDDEWLPNKIEEQLKAFTSEDIALVYCGNKTMYDATGAVVENFPECVTENVYEKLLYSNFIGSTSFPLLRTSALRKIGGFDVEMQSAQDYDVWLRISKEFSVNVVNMPLVLYHFHQGEQITKNPAKKIAGLERLAEKNWDAIKANKDIWWHRTIKIAPWYTRNKQVCKSFCTWFKAAVKCPLKIRGNLTYLYSIFRIIILKDKA